MKGRKACFRLCWIPSRFFERETLKLGNPIDKKCLGRVGRRKGAAMEQMDDLQKRYLKLLSEKRKIAYDIRKIKEYKDL